MVFDSRYPNSVINVNEEKKMLCPICGRLLFKGEVYPPSVISIKCSKGCRNLIKIRYM